MKNNGICFVEVPIQPVEAAELWGHYHCFTSDMQVVDLFVSNGFEFLEEEKMNPPSKKPWYRCVFKKGK